MHEAAFYEWDFRRWCSWAPLLHLCVCPAQPKMITDADCEVSSAQDWKSLILSFFGAKLKMYLTWVASIFYCQMIKRWMQFGMLNVDVTRSSWLSCALRGDEAMYWVSIVHQWLVLVGLYKVSIWWYWLDPDGTGSVWGMYAFMYWKPWISGRIGSLTQRLTDFER